MDTCRSLIFEALTRFRRGNGSNSVRNSHDRSESVYRKNGFVFGKIASQKYLYFGFLSRTRPGFTHARAADCFSSVQRREIPRHQLSKDKKTIILAPRRPLHCVPIGAPQSPLDGWLRSRDRHRWASRPSI